MLDKIIYDFEYLDGHKASLAANIISGNIFSQVDEEGNIFVVSDEIVDHCVDGENTTQKYTFVVPNNGGERSRDTTKG